MALLVRGLPGQISDRRDLGRAPDNHMSALMARCYQGGRSMTLSTEPVWHHTTDNNLVLEIGKHHVPVPEPICTWLLDPGVPRLSADPAIDLVRLEQRLQRLAASFDVHRDRAATTIRDHVALLRRFVIDLHPSQGNLRDAAEGWQRDPRAPASAVVFTDQEQFLDADPRRETITGWGGRTIAGIEEYGRGWRRDGDDERQPHPYQDEDLVQTGPWQVGHIRRSGDIYAIRRGARLPQQVWLLGTGFDAHSDVHDALFPVMPQMRQPNSLILAAGAVHTAQLRRARPLNRIDDSDPQQPHQLRMRQDR